MKAHTDEGTSETVPVPSAEMVAQYLRAHRDFFEEYPDVLRDIEITHGAGDAVSLLERQVAALRDDNARMKGRFEELVALARSNENLIKRIHQLALALMDAAGPEAIFATLTERLAQEFNADRVRTIVFADAAYVDSKLVPEFVGSQSSERNLFRNVLNANVPKCGDLTEAQSACVFSSDPGITGSAAVLPLSGKAWDGLLIISSDEQARFNEDMGTEFLAYLGDIVSLIVDPWVARD